MYYMNKTRYYIVIYLFVLLIIYFLPNLFVKGNILPKEEQIQVNNNLEEINKQIEEKQVNVLIKDTAQVAKMGLEQYIAGVVSAEMPASYEFEALKAQAVVARTYALNKMVEHQQNGNTVHPNADICTDSTHCQAYMSKEERIEKWNNAGEDGLQLWDKIEEAVISTNGIIITYENHPIKAFFHSNSGGKTEDVELVWSGGEIPYLKSVETSGEDNYNQYKSNVTVTYNELEKIMKERYSTFEIDFSKEDCIYIENRSDSNRVQNIKIGNITISGTDARKIFGLKSTNFEFENTGNCIEFYVIGYGHGVGMSQTGANELAKSGYDYAQIINHYYTDVDIIKME